MYHIASYWIVNPIRFSLNGVIYHGSEAGLKFLYIVYNKKLQNLRITNWSLDGYVYLAQHSILGDCLKWLTVSHHLHDRRRSFWLEQHNNNWLSCPFKAIATIRRALGWKRIASANILQDIVSLARDWRGPLFSFFSWIRYMGIRQLNYATRDYSANCLCWDQWAMLNCWNRYFFFFGGLLENWTYVFIKYNKADSFAPSPVIC